MFEFELHSGLSQTNSKFAKKLYIFRKSRKASAFGSGRFWSLPKIPISEEWVKRIHIPKKKATKNEIGLEEYTLRFVSKQACCYRFRPIKPVFPQDSRIVRIHILSNFEILFLEACRFQNSEGL